MVLTANRSVWGQDIGKSNPGKVISVNRELGKCLVWISENTEVSGVGRSCFEKHFTFLSIFG